MSENPALDYSPKNEEVDLQMSDKASSREKSSSFLKLLEESSKYRKKDDLPDLAGQKAGKRLDNLSPRPMPDANGNSEEATTPRLSRRPQEGGPLKKTNNTGVEIEQALPTENKSRYSQFTELPSGPNVPPSTPRSGVRQSVQRQVSPPPVAGPDRRKMNDVLMFSRQGSDIHTKLKRSSSNEAGYGSAPNSPSLTRALLSARRGRIDLDLK